MHPISPFAPSLASTPRLEDRSHALLIFVFLSDAKPVAPKRRPSRIAEKWTPVFR